MASHSKASVLETIRHDGIVPVFHDADPTTCTEVAARVVAGGLSTLEFTNRGDGAMGRFQHLLQWASMNHRGLVLGVGSIVDPGTAAHAIDLGANFVFAPSFSAEVATVCNRRNIPYVPGCGTVTEVQRAYEAGCDIVKLFPAGQLGGPAFLKALRAPCPWVQAIPTGGVEPTEASLGAWYGAGAAAVGIGSKLLPSAMVTSGDWAGLESSVADAVAAVAAARGTAD
ncbi:MAG: bifunctional 4-hydroxy-2-oxoglutarate aldolase/2-dehydro-3-deoxy-phosphogluconate aldolase [Acidimicrobiales bacterium]|nr:bifunctional 4-hydroxy-2-oxoglutarate aldolase/2-dehydro-3-deoxy-phosphogluconate aldolase [Acidimicrobiales bacterium]